MTIQLLFQSLLLGELTFVDGEYVYNSNVEGENKFKSFASALIYNLTESKDKRQKTLFPFFEYQFGNIKKRSDILSKIGCDENSSDFCILFEYGKLSQLEHGFHLLSK